MEPSHPQKWQEPTATPTLLLPLSQPLLRPVQLLLLWILRPWQRTLPTINNITERQQLLQALITLPITRLMLITSGLQQVCLHRE